MRVILDTNVWVSGWLWGGIPGQLIMMGDNQQITISASEGLLSELETTLRRGKLQSKIQSLGSTVEILISRTRQLVELCLETSVDVPQLRDQDDVIIIAAALAANAEVIVTGDQDLLCLNEFEGILIMTSTDFLYRYFPRQQKLL
ncbi:MAG: putative toxin-antitoxin system toxin component, PIN family [Stigonema ocellatum SAG 48.90 = DSM 106950]|nr:putative toxin-antitoxin system toxin component, PIN family [Stigonema ocellatum SAG 48.90 = DSM 106950]